MSYGGGGARVFGHAVDHIRLFAFVVDLLCVLASSGGGRIFSFLLFLESVISFP